MTKLYLINSMLIVVAPNGSMCGKVYHSRPLAVEAYMSTARIIGDSLHNDSCIIN